MQKLFFTICFILGFLIIENAHADVVSLADPGKAKQAPDMKSPADVIVTESLPNPNNQEEIKAFFKQRFENAARSEKDENFDITKPSSIGVLHTPEYYEKQKEAKKTTFQKIYDEAIAALHKDKTSSNATDETSSDAKNQNQAAETATRFFTLAPRQMPQQESIPSVAVQLPSGRKILAPTDEHIPYLLSYIDIQSNGYLTIEETIIIVADGKKFKYGFPRYFPKYAYDAKGKRHNIELILNSVEVNGTNVPYILEEIGNDIIMKPQYNQELEPGVYTYKFNYMMNNKLHPDGDFTLLDWNITGSALNAFITSANAIISLPDGHTFSDAKTFVGRAGKYSTERVNQFLMAKNVLAVSAVTPILNMENMNILTVVNSNLFIKDFDKNFSHFIIDWGKVLYAGLGLLVIFLSFVISLFTLKRNQRNNKYNPSYNGSIMRSILVGKYDRVAFVAQVLELYRKGALNIKTDNGRVFLEKKNIKGEKLSKVEKRGLKRLFGKLSTIEINQTFNVRIKKALKVFEKHSKKQINKYKLRHNIGYLIFSLAMLLVSVISISVISVNFAQSFIILLLTTTFTCFYVWILKHRFKRFMVGLILKIFSITALIFIWLFSSIYIGNITAILLISAVFIIFEFTKIFGQQNSFVNDAKNTISNYKEYLITNSDAINLSRDFINQQANIYALNIMEYFPQNVSNKAYYKLVEADELKRALIEII